MCVLIGTGCQPVMMMEGHLSSPGASCGSPYSDVTSGSPSQYSDAFEPVSPDYVSADALRVDYSVSVPSAASSSSSSSSSDSSSEDIPSTSEAFEEYRFYQTLPVFTPVGMESHVQHLVNKMEAGTLVLPSRTTSPGSLTPYSDVARPKKPGKNGSVKRPMNAFMCFAKAERRNLTSAQPALHNADVSKHLGQVWKECPEELKELYKETATWLKDLHRQENPDYKYKPRKRKAASSQGSPKVSSTSSTSSSSSGSSAASAAPTKPKRVRKAPSKPRTAARARKTSGQPRVVPASPPAALSPPADHSLQLYADINPLAISPAQTSKADVISFAIDSTRAAGDSRRYSADVTSRTTESPYAIDPPRYGSDVTTALVDEWRHQVPRDVKPVLQAATTAASAPAQKQQQQQQPEKPEVSAAAAAAVPEAWHAQAETPKEILEIMDDMQQLYEQSSLMPLFNTGFSEGPYEFELGDNLVQGPHQLNDALDFQGDLDHFFDELL